MKNQPKALVFFDLDGTLLTSDVSVAQSSIDAINKLKKNNIKPIIATGRTVCEIKHIMDHTGIDSIVAMNGQVVIYEGKNIFSNNINPNVIERLLDFSNKETGIDISLYSDVVMRISKSTTQSQMFYRYLKQAEPAVDPTIFKSVPIQMLLLLCESGEEIYRKKFPELTFIRNTPYCVDVFNHGGSKAFGIKQLLKINGFETILTFAFGDGLNDLEMFELVSHPIAMANAVEPLKAMAEHITDNNDNDGIAKGLTKLGLIN